MQNFAEHSAWPSKVGPEPPPEAYTTPAPALWAEQTLGFTPDPLQSSVLNSTHTRILVNCCRQWGKSTTAAIRALHHAIHAPGSETILLAPTQRQSAELLRKIRAFALLLPGSSLRSDGANRHSLQLSNASRIVALPGKRDNVRGFSKVGLLVIDEAAWVPDSLYFAVRPFLAAAHRGTLLVMSTPNGDSGFFHHAWIQSESQTNNESQWSRIAVPATSCPRISPAFLEEERQTLTSHAFRQEYMCEFLSHNRAVFSSGLLDQFFSSSNFGPYQPR
jgi:hypothetical protein